MQSSKESLEGNKDITEDDSGIVSIDHEIENMPGPDEDNDPNPVEPDEPDETDDNTTSLPDDLNDSDIETNSHTRNNDDVKPKEIFKSF